MLCMTGIHASKRRKEVACLGVGVWGWGGDICDFSRASQICSLLSAHVLQQNNTHSLIKKSLFHTSLSLHISFSSQEGKKKKSSQEGSVCSGAAIVFSRMDRCTNTPPVCLNIQAGKPRRKGCVLLVRHRKMAGGGKASTQTKKLGGKTCLRLVCKVARKDGYSLISLPPSFLFSTPYGLSGRGL